MIENMSRTWINLADYANAILYAKFFPDVCIE
jgi:hypothetical protein